METEKLSEPVVVVDELNNAKTLAALAAAAQAARSEGRRMHVASLLAGIGALMMPDVVLRIAREKTTREICAQVNGGAAAGCPKLKGARLAKTLKSCPPKTYRNAVA